MNTPWRTAVRETSARLQEVLARVDAFAPLAWDAEMRQRAAQALANGGTPESPNPRRPILDWVTAKHESRWQFDRYRFIALTPLAAGYLHTGDDEYAQAARDYLEEHLEHYLEPPYDDALNLSIRVCRVHGLGP